MADNFLNTFPWKNSCLKLIQISMKLILLAIIYNNKTS